MRPAVSAAPCWQLLLLCTEDYPWDDRPWWRVKWSDSETAQKVCPSRVTKVQIQNNQNKTRKG